MFIPFLADETNIPNSRYCLWAFGGVVEIDPGNAWVWVEKCLLNNSTGASDYKGTVLAQVYPDQSTGNLAVRRMLGTIFSPGEPRIGTLSNVLEGNYVYLFGPTGATILARVPKNNDSIINRDAYEFWNGAAWVKDYRSGAVLFRDIQQGHVFKSTLFGPQKPWVFIGCNKVIRKISHSSCFCFQCKSTLVTDY